MNAGTAIPIAFPPIQRHGMIGDRRTGALVAADGTIDWFCAPDFDGPPVFGALLDPERGGHGRFGPANSTVGKQTYAPGSALLITRWDERERDASMEVMDAMAWPGDERPEAVREQRVIIRRLRVEDDAPARFECRPRRNFVAPETMHEADGGASIDFADGSFGVWTSFSAALTSHGLFSDLKCQAGRDYWVVLGWNVVPAEWSAQRAAAAFGEAERYWREWSRDLKTELGGPRAEALCRSAITVQMLSHAHLDCAVAALTTSLPERMGGDLNYDYRYAWVRDASMSLAFLARMGKPGEVGCYLDWLCRLHSDTEAPLQVCYQLNGSAPAKPNELSAVRGYMDSRPVRTGNRASSQLQLGSLGFLADCARVYLDEGGEWREEFWGLIRRIADFIAAHWQEKDSGIWELPEEAHYVASRVMSWVVLERAAHIAARTGHPSVIEGWREVAAAIHSEVMDKGWCEEKGAFRQRYGSDALDASALLIPLMEFLPTGHPRVASTLDALERTLIVNGLLHRFDPEITPGVEPLPIGEFEGAFLPCVFWHAHALARAGRCEEAEAILARCEAIAGSTGIFAEEADAVGDAFLGNTPLLFSQVEYARAAMELHRARSQRERAAH
jgi:GH15 family glucan-1,4-alpha-glucosidase